MTDEKKPILPEGRLHFGGLIKPRPYQEQIMRALEDAGEHIVPVGSDFVSRMLRADGDDEISLMQPRKPTFVFRIKATDQVSGPMRKIMKHVEHTSFAVYCGRRIADLLTSDDPRQRKRGRRLRDQMFRVGRNFTRGEALALRDTFRDRHPTLKSFWHDNLGEPYDPERYRKD